MKGRFSERVERGRHNGPGVPPSCAGDTWGLFHLTTNEGVRLTVMVSDGESEIPWEHVSVSTRTRCPTWAEMCWVKSLFWDDEEAVMEIHPPRSQWVNQHAFCLHLWKPWGGFKLPPPETVGLKDGPKLVSDPAEAP